MQFATHVGPGSEMFESNTYWIVGASEGLGRALATQLDGLGARLILSARTESRLTGLAEGLCEARVVPMDVSLASQCNNCFAFLLTGKQEK